MADERGIELPDDCDWPSLEARSGTDLQNHYIDILRKLGEQRGLLGDIFAKRGYHGEALERYRGSRAHDPDDTDALRGEVTTLLNLDRAHEAADMIDELARRSRSDVDGLVACAQARLALGEPVPALDHLKQAQALEPGRPDLSQLQAKVAILLGDLGGALEAYQAALQLDPGNREARFNLDNTPVRIEGVS